MAPILKKYFTWKWSESRLNGIHYEQCELLQNWGPFEKGEQFDLIVVNGSKITVREQEFDLELLLTKKTNETDTGGTTV